MEAASIVGPSPNTASPTKGESPLSPNALAPALLCSKQSSDWFDLYRGTSEELIAAGLARADMFPGQPGRGKMQCSYAFPSLEPTGKGRRGDAPNLVIRAAGKRFDIEWPVPMAERERRAKAFRDRLHAGRAAAERKPDTEESDRRHIRLVLNLGEAFANAFDASPARFNVGDTVILWPDGWKRGVEVIITEPYGVHNVLDQGLRLGYMARRKGESNACFCSAGDLLDPELDSRGYYRVRHLRLVQAPASH